MFKFITPVAFIATTVSTIVPSLPAIAGQVSDGRSFFDRAPRLVGATRTGLMARFASTYEFTLTVPTDAGAPLQAVTISQENNAELVNFDIGQSVAFAGDRYGAGERLPLASVGGTESADQRKATIVFDPPIQPGKTVTISLSVERNPSAGGIYLFGVTAYPVGEKATGLFLGYGRLTFYNQQ